MSFFRAIQAVDTGLRNVVNSLDYQKQVTIPLVLACIPGVSMLVTKIRSEHLREEIEREGGWNGKVLHRNSIRRFENDPNVRNFKLLRMVEDIGLLVQKVMLLALTLFNKKMPLPAGVCLFLAGNALFAIYESQRVGVPFLSYNDEPDRAVRENVEVVNVETLVRFS